VTPLPSSVTVAPSAFDTGAAWCCVVCDKDVASGATAGGGHARLPGGRRGYFVIGKSFQAAPD